MDECCGNCANCKRDCETMEWVCTCEDSEAYGLETEFMDYCDEYCERD